MTDQELAAMSIQDRNAYLDWVAADLARWQDENDRAAYAAELDYLLAREADGTPLTDEDQARLEAIA